MPPRCKMSEVPRKRTSEDVMFKVGMNCLVRVFIVN
jgi:hypothetical protein